MKTISRKQQKKTCAQFGLVPTGTKPRNKAESGKQLNPNGPSPKQVASRRKKFELENGTLKSMQTENERAKSTFLEKQKELLEYLRCFDRIYVKANKNNEVKEKLWTEEYLTSLREIHSDYSNPNADLPATSVRTIPRHPQDNNENPEEYFCFENTEELHRKFTELIDSSTRGDEASERILEFRFLEIELIEVEMKKREARKRTEMLKAMYELIESFEKRIREDFRELWKKCDREEIQSETGLDLLQEFAFAPMCRVIHPFPSLIASKQGRRN